jgi:hypothetical protein
VSSDSLRLETTLHFVTFWARKTADGKVILVTTIPGESIEFIGDGPDDDDFLAGATIHITGKARRNPATNTKTLDRVLIDGLD